MMFCESKQQAWVDAWEDRYLNDWDPDSLHLEIGSDPSDAQISDAEALIAADDTFAVGKREGATWLAGEVVETIIHELTHAKAVMGSDNTLMDVSCKGIGTSGGDMSTSNLVCMSLAARGDSSTVDANGNSQTGKDAEAFAKLAMALYYNTVYWWTLGDTPKLRSTWNP
ncbi:hypothetical protein SUNI508_03758 [Seiridium unicorne]|uniref:Lysine-specific metallo-endopeptidase domain-containing protein n=1 Tax=Seiridium unicorne TaxID=138068 RepID=A0ABR2VBH7_9PEZI